MTESLDSQRLDNLRSIPLFHDCSDESLRRILDLATEFEAEKGHVLVQPEQAGAGLFILEEGTVAVESPHRRIELGPAEFFGELALFDERAVHTARVAATEHVKCLAIRRDDLEALLASEPKMALAMLKVLARRLADTAT